METTQIIKVLEETGICMKDSMTHSEYLPELIRMEKLLTHSVDLPDYRKDRVSDLIRFIDSKSKQTHTHNFDCVNELKQDLQQLAKLIAIFRAGDKSENAVKRSIDKTYIDDYHVYQNIYLSNDLDETEIDDVVLTRNGILIIEVKSTNEDVTISEQGRIIKGEDKPSHKILGEQMNNKRYLLKEKLVHAMQEQGINIPVYLDSYVVFDSKRSNVLEVKDLYQAEKYCWTSKLPNIIRDFRSEGTYSLEQLRILNNILKDIKQEEKVYECEIDFNKLRYDFACTMHAFEESSNRSLLNKIKIWFESVTRKPVGNL